MWDPVGVQPSSFQKILFEEKHKGKYLAQAVSESDFRLR